MSYDPHNGGGGGDGGSGGDDGGDGGGERFARLVMHRKAGMEGFCRALGPSRPSAPPAFAPSETAIQGLLRATHLRPRQPPPSSHLRPLPLQSPLSTAKPEPPHLGAGRPAGRASPPSGRLRPGLTVAGAARTGHAP